MEDVYSKLSYDRDELAQAMRETYDEIIDFITTSEFKSIMKELSTLSSQERPSFVARVLMDSKELAGRGVQPPEGVLIQRSAFGDRRPTLFVIKKFLPEKYTDIWQNVNITFDDAFADGSVSRAPEFAWRQPLPVDLQANIMARGEDLQQVSI